MTPAEIKAKIHTKNKQSKDNMTAEEKDQLDAIDNFYWANGKRFSEFERNSHLNTIRETKLAALQSLREQIEKKIIKVKDSKEYDSVLEILELIDKKIKG